MENNIYGLFHLQWEMLAAGDQKIMFIVKVGNQLRGKLSKYFFSIQTWHCLLDYLISIGLTSSALSHIH